MASQLRSFVLPLLLLLPALAPPDVAAFGGGRPSTSADPIGKVRVMWLGDAATTAVVGWASPQAPGADQKLHYDVVDHGPDVAAYAFTRPIDAQNVYKGMNNAFARLSGLQPSTVYYFVIADAGGASRRLWFRTAPADASQRLSFAAGGDSRNNRDPRRNANTLVAKLRPDAVIFDGDYTDSGSDSQWQEWFEDWQLTIAADGRVTPIIPARGNHEGSNDILVKLFDTPSGVYYATRVGGSLFSVYTLNSESSIAGAQTDWLKADLAANPATWRLAQYHRPMRPHVKSKSNGDNQYRYWAPIFQQHRVEVVLECDAHTVKQTWPVRPSTAAGSVDGFVRDDATGTVYIGEGGWGAPLRSNDDVRPWTRDSGKFNHFQWIFADSRELEIRTVMVDGAAAAPTLTDDTRFTVPAGIPLWAPGNGGVVKVVK